MTMTVDSKQCILEQLPASYGDLVFADTGDNSEWRNKKADLIDKVPYEHRNKIMMFTPDLAKYATIVKLQHSCHTYDKVVFGRECECRGNDYSYIQTIVPRWSDVDFQLPTELYGADLDNELLADWIFNYCTYHSPWDRDMHDIIESLNKLVGSEYDSNDRTHLRIAMARSLDKLEVLAAGLLDIDSLDRELLRTILKKASTFSD